MNENAIPTMPWSEFFWQMFHSLLGRRKAPPLDQIPLPTGRLQEMARFAVNGDVANIPPQQQTVYGAVDMPESVMLRQDAMTSPEGNVGRMLTDQERKQLSDLIQTLLK